MKLETKMKTIFKSTLLAVSIAAVCGSAVAGDNTTVAQTYSLEGISSVTVAATSNTVTYVTKAGYAVGDKVTFTFSAGALDTTNTFAPTITLAGVSGMAGMALGLLNEGTDFVTYRVTDVTPVDAGDSTIGQIIDLGTVELKASSVTAGKTTVTVASETATGDELDSSSSTGESRTATLTDVKTQFGAIKVASAAGFDGVIDVAEGRKALDTASDDLVFTISQIDTTGWVAGSLVTATATAVTLDADLAGFESADISSTSGTVSYDDTKKQVSVTYTSAITTDTIVITPPTGTDAVILASQDFEVAGAYTYDTNKTATVGSTDAGEWTLNGAVVNVPYMPYADSIDQIMYVTNEGSLDADISVMAFDEAGNDYDLGVIAVSKAGSVEAIAGAVETALEAQGFTKGKVSLTITVNAQDKDISIYAAYNVGGSDRGTVTNSQYKQK